MSDNNLHVHVTLEDGVIARISPKALNNPEFIAAMNQLIQAAKRANKSTITVSQTSIGRHTHKLAIRCVCGQRINPDCPLHGPELPGATLPRHECPPGF